MPMSISDVQTLVKKAIPDAVIELQDVKGDNTHYSITVTSALFEGKSRIAQHKMVTDAMDGHIGSSIHAMAVTTKTPQAAGSGNSAIFDRIQKEISENDVVLFMKGTRQMPQCGFSGTVVQILEQLGVSNFKTVNVLDEPQVREGIKEFTKWPTIPQLYIKGEFIGGCDIVREMYNAGELAELLRAKGLKSAA